MSDSLKQTAQNLGYAQYATTTPAFSLYTAPSTNATNVYPDTDPSSLGIRATAILMQAEVQNIRWTDDGTTPTSAVGFILYAGDQPFLYDGDLNKLKFIQAASGALLNVAYYR